ncbi:MAG: efflux RND transporter periplasmic adaptor subunit [Nitrosomonas sp.]|nr:efflux RND transporter periplasmic adaptor subunit [Nitrosomonas sp.]MDP1950785.1 efflux RND transporter periplasmic adaptor subunit [Nitrosomonas sp.]
MRFKQNTAGQKLASNYHSTIILLVSLLLAACSNSEPIPEITSVNEAIPVSVIQVQPTSVPISVETVAQAEGAKEVEIRPRVSGILLKQLYTEGSPVDAGQPLFLIDPAPFKNTLAEVRAQLLEQSIVVEQAKVEESRQHRLVTENFVSQRVYDSAAANLAIAKAALQSAKVRVQQAELNLSYTTVTAPVNGVTGRSEFSEGSLVTAHTSLLTTIAQLSPIWVRFSFSDNELVRFGGRLNEQNVEKVWVILPDGSTYQQEGEINFAASQIDPLLGTQQLRATFENEDQRLLPGQFVRVRVTAGESTNVFIVPQVAVLTSDLGRYVYVVNEKNEVTVRAVVAGDWIGKDWIILEGLNAGDKVIVDNIIRLSPGKVVVPQLSDTSLMQSTL